MVWQKVQKEKGEAGEGKHGQYNLRPHGLALHTGNQEINITMLHRMENGDIIR